MNLLLAGAGECVLCIVLHVCVCVRKREIRVNVLSCHVAGDSEGKVAQ